MAVASSSTASSSFAALLKQSKFASYSPSIAQVYTTYGGHATRGDWGVKRPLSARKRNQALLIQSIDSREQQTEFRSAESEAKMVERWQETGMDISGGTVGRYPGMWKAQLDNRPPRELDIDSEFCSYTPEEGADIHPENAALRLKTPPSIEATPDINLMSTKDFEAYLERVRKLRPAFRKYIKQKRPAIGTTIINSPTTDLYRIRALKQGDDIANAFLNELSYQLHGSPQSQTLEPYPHRNGGLYYPRPNSFQTSLLYPAIPARLTSAATGPGVGSGSMRVSAAGITITIPPHNNENHRPLDWHRENLIPGRAPVRFTEVTLYRAPQAVTTKRSAPSELSFSAPAGRSLRRNRPDLTEPPFTYPSGLKETTIDITGATVRDQTARSNPYPPGSIPYSITPDLRPRPKFRPGPRPLMLGSRFHALDSKLSTTNVGRINKTRESMLGNLDALLSRVVPGDK
jgi:Mitochondrial ribosomal protein subunit